MPHSVVLMIGASLAFSVFPIGSMWADDRFDAVETSVLAIGVSQAVLVGVVSLSTKRCVLARRCLTLRRASLMLVLSGLALAGGYVGPAAVDGSEL